MDDLILNNNTRLDSLLTKRPNIYTRSKSELKLKNDTDITPKTTKDKNTTISKIRFNRLNSDRSNHITEIKTDRSSHNEEIKTIQTARTFDTRKSIQDLTKLIDTKTPTKQKSRSITPQKSKSPREIAHAPSIISQKDPEKSYRSNSQISESKINERPSESMDKSQIAYQRRRFNSKSRERSSIVFFGASQSPLKREFHEEDNNVFNPNITAENLVTQEYTLRYLNDIDMRFSPNKFIHVYSEKKWSIQALMRRIFHILRILDVMKKISDNGDKPSHKKAVSFNLNSEFEKYATSRFDTYNHLGFLLERFSQIRDTDFAYSNEVSISVLQNKMYAFKESMADAKKVGANLDKEIKPHVLKDSVFTPDQNQKERKIVDFYISILNEMNEIIEISMKSSIVFEAIMKKGFDPAIHKSNLEFHPVLVKLWRNLEANIGRYDTLYEKIDAYLINTVRLMRLKFFYHTNKEKIRQVDHLINLDGFEEFAEEITKLDFKQIFNQSDITMKHFESLQSKFKNFIWNLAILKSVEKIELENTPILLKALKLMDFATRNSKIIYSDKKTVSDIGFSYALNDVLYTSILSVEKVVSQLSSLHEKYKIKFTFLEKSITDIDNFRMKMEDINHKYNTFLKVEFERIETNYKEMCEKINYFEMSINAISKNFLTNPNYQSDKLSEQIQSATKITKGAQMSKEKLSEFKEMFNSIKVSNLSHDTDYKVAENELILALNEKLNSIFIPTLEEEFDLIDTITKKGVYSDIILRTLEFFDEKSLNEGLIDVITAEFVTNIMKLKKRAFKLISEHEKPIKFLEEYHPIFLGSSKRLKYLVSFIEDFLEFHENKLRILIEFANELFQTFDTEVEPKQLFYKLKSEIKKIYENFKLVSLFEYQKAEVTMKFVLKRILFNCEKEFQILDSIEKLTIKGQKILRKFDAELYMKYPECWKLFEEKDDNRSELLMVSSWKSVFENFQKEIKSLSNLEKLTMPTEFQEILDYVETFFTTKKNNLESLSKHFEFKNKFHLDAIKNILSFQCPKLKDNWKRIEDISTILKSHFMALEKSEHKETNERKNLYIMHSTFQEYFRYIIEILDQLMEFQNIPTVYFNDSQFNSSKILDAIINLLGNINTARQNISHGLSNSKNSQKYVLIRRLTDSFLETFIKSFMSEYIDLSEKIKHLEFIESYISKNEDLLELETLIHDGDFVHHREHTLNELLIKLKKIQNDLDKSIVNMYFEDNMYLIINLKKYSKKLENYQTKIHSNLVLAREFTTEKKSLVEILEISNSGIEFHLLNKHLRDKYEKSALFVLKLDECLKKDDYNHILISELKIKTQSVLQFIDSIRKNFDQIESDSKNRFAKFGNIGFISNMEFCTMLRAEYKIYAETSILLDDYKIIDSSPYMRTPSVILDEGLRFDYYKDFKTAVATYIDKSTHLASKLIDINEVVRTIYLKLQKKSTFINYFTEKCNEIIEALEKSTEDSVVSNEASDKFENVFEDLLAQADSLELFIHPGSLKRLGIISIEATEAITKNIFDENFSDNLAKILEYKKELYSRDQSIEERLASLRYLLDTIIVK